MRAMKKYMASNVWLNVDLKFAPANGSLQFTICVKATSKKKVAELIALQGGGHTSLSTLNSFNGLCENPRHIFEPPENEVVYFRNDNNGTPYWGEWLKLSDNNRIV